MAETLPPMGKTLQNALTYPCSQQAIVPLLDLSPHYGGQVLQQHRQRIWQRKFMPNILEFGLKLFVR